MRVKNGLQTVYPRALYHKLVKYIGILRQSCKHKQRHFPTHRAETAVGIRWGEGRAFMDDSIRLGNRKSRDRMTRTRGCFRGVGLLCSPGV